MFLLKFVLVLLVFLEVFMLECRSKEIEGDSDEVIEVFNGEKQKRFDKILLQTTGVQFVFNNYPDPTWKASATIISDPPSESGPKGEISFYQWSPHNYLRISANLTNLPVGKHAVHIHAFGDLSKGCNSTGPHMDSNFIGNIEAKENGVVSLTMYSSYLVLFGFEGIIGRSVVIHEKPIEIDPTPIFSSPLTNYNFRIEEIDVGPPIACGIISITSNLSK